MKHLDHSVTKKAAIEHAQAMCKEYPNVCYSWCVLYRALEGTSEAWSRKKLIKKFEACADYEYYLKVTQNSVGEEVKEETKGFIIEALKKFGIFIGVCLALLFSLVGVFLFAIMPEVIWVPPIVLAGFIIVVVIYVIVVSKRGRGKFEAHLIDLIEKEGYSKFLNQPELYQ